MVAFSMDTDGPQWFDLYHARFALILPEIRQEANDALRAVPPHRRQALIEEVVHRAFGTFMSLAARGKSQLAYAKPLTMVAVKQLRAGRRWPRPR